jgi:large subunit ribosomal protein L21
MSKMIYAIVETGGKQYKVSPGQIIEVAQLPEEEGSTVELDRVLLVAEEDKFHIGRPVVAARVRATVLGQGKGEKVTVFKYKPKVRYRRKRGHRQPYTKLAIDEIAVG